MSPRKLPTVLVSSAVLGFEDLLNLVFGTLHSLGYEVWMSHRGTLPVSSGDTPAMQDCLQAVKDCDYYFGIILPRYGSGKETPESLSITHEELKLAIKLEKPRWILAHDHVYFARQLLNQVGLKGKAKRKDAAAGFRPSPAFDDLRIIDMLELAMRHDIREVKDRNGNWVQKFIDKGDANLFAESQFSKTDEALRFIKKQIGTATVKGKQA